MESTETKADRILDSALEVFCRYGFQKTSMLDIAEAAGMSRAALYLHFTNKEDVFVSGSIRAHAAVMRAVEVELRSEGDACERIEAGLVAYFDGLIRRIAESEHGAELFDANVELIGAVARESRNRLLTLIAEVLTEADARGEVVLGAESGDDLAHLLAATVDGLTLSPSSRLSVTAGIALQLRMVRAAIADRENG